LDLYRRALLSSYVLYRYSCSAGKPTPIIRLAFIGSLCSHYSCQIILSLVVPCFARVLFGRYRSLVLLRFAAHNTNRCAHSIACTFALLTMCSFAALILYWCSLAHYIVALCVRSLVVHVSSLRSSMSCLVTSLLDCVYLAIARTR
jgi:hypothetical protein